MLPDTIIFRMFEGCSSFSKRHIFANTRHFKQRVFNMTLTNRNSGVARRRKVGGTNFFPKKQKKQKKKVHSGVKAHDRVLWIGECL